MGIKKDFTEATYNRLCSLIDEQEDAKKDIFGRIQDGLGDCFDCKEIDFAKYKNDVDTYYDNYVNQTNISKKDLTTMFNSVNSTDETYGARLGDENADIDKLKRRIITLAKYMDSSSGGAFNKDYSEIEKVLNAELTDFDESTYEYYCKRFYTVNADGSAILNFHDIEYEFSKSKEEISNEELLALSSALFFINGEDSAEDLERFIKCGYNKIDPKDWTYNSDLPEMQGRYAEVGLSDTFKEVVSLYSKQLDSIDYREIRNTYGSEDESSYNHYQTMMSNKAVLTNIIANCSTIRCDYEVFNVKRPLDNSLNHPDMDSQREVAINYNKLPISIKRIENSDKLKIDHSAYTVTVTSHESMYGDEKKTKFDVYGLLSADNVDQALFNSIQGVVTDEINGYKQSTASIASYFDGRISANVKKEAIGYINEQLMTTAYKKIPVVSEAVTLAETFIDQQKIKEANQAIDKQNEENAEMFYEAEQIDQIQKVFHAEVQVVKINNKLRIENFYFDREQLDQQLANEPFSSQDVYMFLSGMETPYANEIKEYCINHHTPLKDQ